MIDRFLENFFGKIDEITDTDSKISDKLFNNVKIIKHCKTTIDRITKFRIE